MTLTIPPELAQMPVSEVKELLCRQHVGVWAQRKLGFVNAPLHWEWYRLVMSERRLCVVAPREHGKALALDTPVLTATGHRRLDEIRVGDEVLGGDGKPTVVTAVSETFTDHDCYRVTLDDGQSFIADAGHRWVTNYAWRGSRVVTTEQMAADHAARTSQRHVIDCVPAFLDGEPGEVDPYILGCWLGDGTSTAAEITTADPEILEAFKLAGYEISYRRDAPGCARVGFAAGWDRGRSLLSQLRRLGVLGNKHIPERYLWADYESRLALLQGLCDTDGSCSLRGQVDFRVTNRDLRDGVAHLVWSLGWKPKLFEGRAGIGGRDCGPYYGVWWYPDVPVFRLARKANAQRQLGMTNGKANKVKVSYYDRTPRMRRSKATGRAVVDIQRTLTVPVRCLATEVGTFMIGEAVVTHNTQVFTVAQAAWRSIYWPGHWTYVFAQTGGQAQGLLERIDQAVEYAEPRLTERAVVDTADLSEYANGSKVTVAGMGKAVRSVHPDLIIGDDVLSDETCATALQREKVETWWHGTVGGMTHPGTDRLVKGEQRRFEPTRVFLVGTAFHKQDLLLSMKTNLVYRFRRYSAEFHADDLVDGLAVEVA